MECFNAPFIIKLLASLLTTLVELLNLSIELFCYITIRLALMFCVTFPLFGVGFFGVLVEPMCLCLFLPEGLSPFLGFCAMARLTYC